MGLTTEKRCYLFAEFDDELKICDVAGNVYSYEITDDNQHIALSIESTVDVRIPLDPHGFPVELPAEKSNRVVARFVRNQDTISLEPTSDSPVFYARDRTSPCRAPEDSVQGLITLAEQTERLEEELFDGDSEYLRSIQRKVILRLSLGAVEAWNYLRSRKPFEDLERDTLVSCVKVAGGVDKLFQGGPSPWVSALYPDLQISAYTQLRGGTPPEDDSLENLTDFETDLITDGLLEESQRNTYLWIKKKEEIKPMANDNRENFKTLIALLDAEKQKYDDSLKDQRDLKGLEWIGTLAKEANDIATDDVEEYVFLESAAGKMSWEQEKKELDELVGKNNLGSDEINSLKKKKKKVEALYSTETRLAQSFVLPRTRGIEALYISAVAERAKATHLIGAPAGRWMYFITLLRAGNQDICTNMNFVTLLSDAKLSEQKEEHKVHLLYYGKIHFNVEPADLGATVTHSFQGSGAEMKAEINFQLLQTIENALLSCGAISRALPIIRANLWTATKGSYAPGGLDDIPELIANLVAEETTYKDKADHFTFEARSLERWARWMRQHLSTEFTIKERQESAVRYVVAQVRYRMAPDWTEPWDKEIKLRMRRFEAKFRGIVPLPPLPATENPGGKDPELEYWDEAKKLPLPTEITDLENPPIIFNDFIYYLRLERKYEREITPEKIGELAWCKHFQDMMDLKFFESADVKRLHIYINLLVNEKVDDVSPDDYVRMADLEHKLVRQGIVEKATFNMNKAYDGKTKPSFGTEVVLFKSSSLNAPATEDAIKRGSVAKWTVGGEILYGMVVGKSDPEEGAYLIDSKKRQVFRAADDGGGRWKWQREGVLEIDTADALISGIAKFRQGKSESQFQSQPDDDVFL